jgi:hypothetical protein
MIDRQHFLNLLKQRKDELTLLYTLWANHIALLPTGNDPLPNWGPSLDDIRSVEYQALLVRQDEQENDDNINSDYAELFYESDDEYDLNNTNDWM